MTNEITIAVAADPGPVLSPELLAAYADIYAEPPYREGPDEIAEFAAEWAVMVAEPGFRLALAIAGTGELAGFVLGHVLHSGSDWWAGIRPAPPPAITAEHVDPDGNGRSFGIAELGVRSAWRRRGIARRLHDTLLAGRPEERSVLWARVDAPNAQAVYAGWGYRRFGTVQRPPDRVFDVLCLDLVRQ